MYYSPRMPSVTFPWKGPVLECSHIHISQLIKHWSQIWMLTIQRWFDLAARARRGEGRVGRD